MGRIEIRPDDVLTLGILISRAIERALVRSVTIAHQR